MNCDICRKQARPPRLILRWRNHWPDRRITQVALLHPECDTHSWPADGYGHIDARALGSAFCAELCERSESPKAVATVQEVFLAYGYIGQEIPAQWHASEFVDDDHLPF